MWYTSQPPARHFPLVPHIACGVVAHLCWGSTTFCETEVQVPVDPARLQAWQAFVHGPLQHTPCEQYCLPSWANWHSLEALQAAPAGFSPHDPLTQLLVPPHCPAVWVQDVKHFEPLHAYGKHDWPPGGMHCPLALQVDGGVYAPPTQVSWPHTMSTGYFRHAPFPSHLLSVPHEAAPWSLHWP